MSGAPIIRGTNQLPKPPISAGITRKKTMMSPCAVISTFQNCPGSDDRNGRNLQTRLLQFHPHHDRDRRADNAREQRQRQIERADVLVIR